MSRRATNADSTRRRVKEEKIKVKEERNKGKQRARVDEEEEEQRPSPDAEEDEDAAGEPNNDEEAGSPRGAKRIRVNGDGDSAPGGSQNDDAPLPKVKTLPRGSDG